MQPLQRTEHLGNCTPLAQGEGLAQQLGRENCMGYCSTGTISQGMGYSTAVVSNTKRLMCSWEKPQMGAHNFFPKVLLKNPQTFGSCPANTVGLHPFSLLRADVATPSLFLMKDHFYVGLPFIFNGHLVHVNPNSSALQRVMHPLCSHVASAPCRYCPQLKGTFLAADSPPLTA